MFQSEPKTGGDEEYQNQHFGFGSQRLNIAMRQMLEHKIAEAIKSMVDFLQQSFLLNDSEKIAVTEFSDKLLQKYIERMGPSIDIIDAEVERIMKVPSNVLLPDGECQLEQVSEPELENLQEEIASLNIRIEGATYLKSLLIAEEEVLDTGYCV